MKAIKVVIAVVFLIKAVDIKSDLKIFSFNRVLKSIEAGMENIKEYKEGFKFKTYKRIYEKC